MQVSDDINDYCDPSIVQTLPFPYLGPKPERFRLENGCFRFYGRTGFRELYEEADNMAVGYTWLCYLEGTLGAGKSHTLAAIVCLLMRKGKAIVYLPDCHHMLANSSSYLQQALLLTFVHDGYYGEQMLSLALEDSLTDQDRGNRLKGICNSAAKAHQFLLFMIDQTNALDEVSGGHDRFSNEAKAGVRAFLDGITHRHMKLASSTANYAHGIYDELRETSERRLTFRSCLDMVINLSSSLTLGLVLILRVRRSSRHGGNEIGRISHFPSPAKRSST